MGVLGSQLAARWFTFDRQIALSFASAVASLTFCCAAFVSSFSLPYIAEAIGLQYTIIIVNSMVFISGFCCILLIVFDVVYLKYLHLNDHLPAEVSEGSPSSGDGITPVTAGTSGGSISAGTTISSAKTIVLIDDSKFSKTHEYLHKFKRLLNRLVQSVRLPLIYWVLTATLVCYYGSALAVVSFLNEYFTDSYGYSSAMSAIISSLIYGIATVLLLPLGFFIDRFGHRLSMTVIGMLLTVVGFVLLLFTSVTPWVGSSVLGVSYAVIPAAIWPTFALIVDETKLGLAYGLATSLLNGSLFLVPLIAGFIPSYFYKIVLLLSIAFCGLILSILLWILDRVQYGGKVELTCIKKSKSELSKRDWRILSFLRKLRRRKHHVAEESVANTVKDVKALLKEHHELKRHLKQHDHNEDKQLKSSPQIQINDSPSVINNGTKFDKSPVIEVGVPEKMPQEISLSIVKASVGEYKKIKNCIHGKSDDRICIDMF